MEISAKTGINLQACFASLVCAMRKDAEIRSSARGKSRYVHESERMDIARKAKRAPLRAYNFFLRLFDMV